VYQAKQVDRKEIDMVEDYIFIDFDGAIVEEASFYDDEAGLTAARSVRPFVIQSYRREMGQGQGGHVREIAVPIFVNDRHWGGLKVGFRLTPSPVTAE
jgi:methyl-accepting chemotaxis protein